MKKILLSALAFATSMMMGISAQAQRSCGTMQHLQTQLENDPHLADRMNQVERATEQWINSGTANKTQAVITIPVVVHVLYNTTAQNISDAQVQSQIDVLNEDFRKLNADVALTPAGFAGLAADCQIQFCLAKQDPAGNATTGIHRVSTTVTSWTTNDNMKYTSKGGADAWDATRYLNLWACNLGQGLLGYAQFPGGAAATDGVVILYSAFGRVGTVGAPYNKGRTATHEVGHWLNLRHIWGDANCGNDQVSDTPTQQTSNYGCPSFPHVTCSNGTNGDMFMNYMDYTDDACMYMFTTGQSTRMTAAINTSRVGLLTSNGCTAPAGGGTCAVASGLSASSITTTTATLNWAAVSGASSYNVQYRVVGAATWTAATSATTSLAVSSLTASTNYEFQVQTVCASGSAAFSNSATFTTSAVSTGCTDSYESNNSRTAAKTIATNTDIYAKIGTSTDKDYYKFTTVSGTTNIKMVLDQLPADYDLRLLNSSGTTLATSANASTTSEQIIRNTTTAATYYAYVYGYSSAFNANVCYHLRVNTSGTAFRDQNSGVTSSETVTLNAEKIKGLDEVSVFPNPASSNLNLNFFITNSNTIQAEVVDMIGKTVMHHSFTAEEGFNSQQVDISSLNNGIYFMRIQQGDQSVVRKFVVKH